MIELRLLAALDRLDRARERIERRCLSENSPDRPPRVSETASASLRTVSEARLERSSSLPRLVLATIAVGWLVRAAARWSAG
jgi:hypothetical protein